MHVFQTLYYIQIYEYRRLVIHNITQKNSLLESIWIRFPLSNSDWLLLQCEIQILSQFFNGLSIFEFTGSNPACTVFFTFRMMQDTLFTRIQNKMFDPKCQIWFKNCCRSDHRICRFSSGVRFDWSFDCTPKTHVWINWWNALNINHSTILIRCSITNIFP